MLSVTRTALLIVLLEDNFGNKTPEPGRGNLLQSQFSYLMDILVQMGHILEYVALMSGFTLFLLKLRKDHDGEKCIDHVWKSIKAFSCKTSIVIGLTILAVIIISLHVSVSFTPSTFLLVHRNEVIPSYNQFDDVGLSYGALAMLSHFTNAITGIALIIATAIVLKLWCHGATVLDQSNATGGDQKVTFNELIDNYHDTGKSIAAIQTIFEGWFVAYWTSYFFRMILDATNVVKSLTAEDDKLMKEIVQIRFISVHLLYDFVNLMLTYTCGQLMNTQHQRYYKVLRKKQREFLKNIESQSGFYLQCAPLIPKKRSYQFIPSFCGLSIPVDNLGYLLTVLLAIFAIITTVTFDYVEP